MYKRQLLRCLNFLERPDTGIIKVNGETMWDAADPATQRESCLLYTSSASSSAVSIPEEIARIFWISVMGRVGSSDSFGSDSG